MLGWAPGMERGRAGWRREWVLRVGGRSDEVGGGRRVVGLHAGARGDGPGGFGVGGRADRSAFADKPSERQGWFDQKLVKNARPVKNAVAMASNVGSERSGLAWASRSVLLDGDVETGRTGCARRRHACSTGVRGVLAGRYAGVVFANHELSKCWLVETSRVISLEHMDVEASSGMRRRARRARATCDASSQPGTVGFPHHYACAEG